jgi:hypothetical protein
MPSIAAPNDKSESLPGYSPKLEFKYFLIQLFHVTAIVLIPDMYGCYGYLSANIIAIYIGVRVFQDISQSWNSNIF